MDVAQRRPEHFRWDTWDKLGHFEPMRDGRLEVGGERRVAGKDKADARQALGSGDAVVVLGGAW